MVGRLTLAQSIRVRILVPQPIILLIPTNAVLNGCAIVRMKITTLFIILLFSTLLPITSFSEGKKQELTSEEFRSLATNYFFKDLKPISRFGFIRVLLDDNSEKIGLDQSELTDYAHLVFKNNFDDIIYDEKLNEAWVRGELREKHKTGVFMFHLSTVGDNFPIAYLAECRGGHFRKYNIWEDRTLGYSSDSKIQDKVKQLIGKCIQDFSSIFFKVKRVGAGKSSP
jgi:hypothetical protein